MTEYFEWVKNKIGCKPDPDLVWDKARQTPDAIIRELCECLVEATYGAFYKAKIKEVLAKAETYLGGLK